MAHDLDACLSFSSRYYTQRQNQGTRTSSGPSSTNQMGKQTAHSCLCSVVSDALGPHGLKPARFLCHGTSQARILEWVAISSSRRSSQSRDQTHFSCITCIGRKTLCHQATWEAQALIKLARRVAVLRSKQCKLGL